MEGMQCLCTKDDTVVARVSATSTGAGVPYADEHKFKDQLQGPLLLRGAIELERKHPTALERLREERRRACSVHSPAVGDQPVILFALCAPRRKRGAFSATGREEVVLVQPAVELRDRRGVDGIGSRGREHRCDVRGAVERVCWIKDRGCFNTVDGLRRECEVGGRLRNFLHWAGSMGRYGELILVEVRRRRTLVSAIEEAESAGALEFEPIHERI